MKKFKEFCETSYEELRDLGAIKGIEKSDGKKPTISGKNYSKGYYQKKLTDALKDKDLVGAQIYKNALSLLDRNKVNYKVEK